MTEENFKRTLAATGIYLNQDYKSRGNEKKKSPIYGAAAFNLKGIGVFFSPGLV